MKLLNLVAVAVICVSCAKITGTPSGNTIQPKTNYPKITANATNIVGDWAWTCHTENPIGLPNADSFIESTQISGSSFTTTIQAYSDGACKTNAYTVTYSSTYTLSFNPTVLNETRTSFNLVPLNDAVSKLLNDTAHSNKNPFCSYFGWKTGVTATQYMTSCKLPSVASRSVTLYSNGASSELFLSSCLTSSNCANADYLTDDGTLASGTTGN